MNQTIRVWCNGGLRWCCATVWPHWCKQGDGRGLLGCQGKCCCAHKTDGSRTK